MMRTRKDDHAPPVIIAEDDRKYLEQPRTLDVLLEALQLHGGAVALRVGLLNIAERILPDRSCSFPER